MEKPKLRAKRNTNPKLLARNNWIEEICAIGASSNISGRRSNNERAIKKPAEKAHTMPMLFLSFFTKMPAERVAAKATITDNIIGRLFS